MSKVNVKRVRFNGAALCSLLKRVHLKGDIDECVLDIKDGVGYIQAVDMSNSVFVSCQETLGEIQDMSIGLGKLSLLIQFLDGSTEVSYSIETKDKEGIWLTLRKGQGKIKVLLIDGSMIPTVVQGDAKNIKKDMLKLTTNSFSITQTTVNSIMEYIGMIGCTSVFFKIRKGAVIICSNPSSEQQFSLTIGRLKEVKDDMSVEVYSQYLLSILKSLMWSEEEIPKVYIGNNAPVVVKQNNSNLWALTPIITE